jgi:hypothetical protein
VVIDVVGVRIGERIEKLERELDCRTLRELAFALENRFQGIAFDVFQNQIWDAIGFGGTNVEYLRDSEVRKIADVLDSTGKNFGRNEGGTEYLQRHRTLDLGIVGEVDNALEPSAEFSNEFIATVTSLERIVHSNPVWLETTSFSDVTIAIK